MSDLIRRDDALGLLHYHCDEHCSAVVSDFEKLPAVDAVEVVRCKDCVNNPRISTKTKGMVWCRKFRSEVRPNDFCSYGERREENAVD